METQQIKKEIRLLKGYAVFSTALFILFISVGFRNGKDRFSEIDVERINIIKEDGTIDMVITNAARVPDPVMNGKVIGKRQVAANPAMGFYNGEGDEIGGMTYGVNEYNGKKVAKTALLFDQYKNDEVMQLFYQEVVGGGGKIAGLEIKDRPSNISIVDLAAQFANADKLEGEERAKAMEALQKRSKNGEFGGSRMFIGAINGLPVLNFNDQSGQTRIRMAVDKEGNPSIEFLDQNGKVTHTFPN